MTADRMVLEQADRSVLIAQASALGVTRPEVLTRVELIDEILRLKTTDPIERRRVRGWLGVARDLLASVVEQGLNMPDAAAIIRGNALPDSVRPPAPPVATVTLAEIYRAQGHLKRAISTLEEVLDAEPDHPVALRLRTDFIRQLASSDLDSGVLNHAEAAPRGQQAAWQSESSPTVPSPAGKPAAGLASDTLVAQAQPDSAAVKPAPEHREPAWEQSGRLETSAAVAEGPPEPTVPRDNALVAVRLPGGGLYLYWELSYSPAHRAPGSTQTVIRVLECRPRPQGAERLQHRVEPAEQSGGLVLAGVAADAAVRAVVGIDDARGYQPLAVAVECRQDPAGALDLLFVPWQRADLSAVTRRAAAALGAHELC